MNAFPNKKYEIIYCDPPWHYGATVRRNNGDLIPIEHYYPTMTMDQLKAMPVKDIAEDNSLCFMWVTGAFMGEAIKLLEAWGFKYKTVAFVWDKQRNNMGYYTMSYCEFVLVGKRGKIPRPFVKPIKQLFSEKRREHSRKPQGIRTLIEERWPTQSKIELFAREKPLGWDVWGNETEKFGEVK